jgi:hypothetical protein
MRSPDGSIEVVRKRNFAPPEVAIWCGWIEIPGHHFLLRGRKFTGPMVFSPNSRFLALTEFTCDPPQQVVRVVVLDFLTGRQIIVHDEKSERLGVMETITSLRWTDDVTLRIGSFAGDFSEGERTHIWKAV